MSKITQTITSDISDVEKKLAKLQEEHLKLKQKMQETVDASKQGTKESGDAFDGLGKKVVALAGTYLSVQSAISLVKKEFEAMTEAQERARQASMTTAEAEREALVNLGAKTKEERDKFTADIAAMSARTGVSMKDLYRGASFALSAKGPLSYEAALSAVELSARYVPGSAEGASQFGGAVLSIQKAMQGRGQKVSAEQAAGYLAAVGETSQIVNPKDIAANIGPALAAMMSTGAGEKAAGAMFGAFTSALSDVTGAESRTASQKFAMQLEKWLPEKDRFEETIDPTTKQIRKRLAAKGTGAATMEERLALLQSDAKARSFFISSADLDQVKPFVRDFAEKRGPLWEAYQANLAAMPTMAQGAAQFTAKLGVMEGSPLQQLSEMERRLTTGAEALQLANLPGARMAMLRKQMGPLLHDTGLGWAASGLAGLSLEGGPRPMERFLSILEQRRRQLESPKLAVQAFDETGGAADAISPPTAVELAQAAMLKTLIAELTRLMKEQTTETRALNESIRGNQASQAAAAAKKNGKE